MTCRGVTNKYLLKQPGKDYDVEWGYAFDVHLNAFYPLLVILHFLQLFFINREWGSVCVCVCVSSIALNPKYYKLKGL